MKKMNRFLIQYIGWLTLGVIVLGLILGAFEMMSPALTIPWTGIGIAGTALFVYNCIAMFFCLRTAQQNKDRLLSFYLLNKTLRIILFISIFLLFFFFSTEGNKVAFSVIFFIYYLFFICMESLFMVRMEAKATKV